MTDATVREYERVIDTGYRSLAHVWGGQTARAT